MKTSRLAIAVDSGRVDARCAQACGFVSRTMDRRDGGGPSRTVSYRSRRHQQTLRTFFALYLAIRAVDGVHCERLELSKEPS